MYAHMCECEVPALLILILYMCTHMCDVPGGGILCYYLLILYICTHVCEVSVLLLCTNSICIHTRV